MIKKNKEHNKEKLIRELQAKNILLQCYKKRYFNIENSEKPDLIDKVANIGIEVVLSTNQDKENFINAFKKNNPTKINDAKNTTIFHSQYENKLACAFYWVDYNYLLNSFNDKLQKLHKVYCERKFNAYDLYIKAESVGVDVDEIEPLLKGMVLAQEKAQYKYRYVYIQFLPFIYCFDLQNNICEHKELTQEFCTNLDTIVKKEYDHYK